MRIRNIFFTLLIVLVGAFTWWVQKLAEELDVEPMAETEIRDFYVVDYEIAVTDEDGRIKYEHYGERLDHWKKSEELFVENPRFTLHQADTPPFYIRAERGKVDGDGKKAYLLGEVVLDREAFGQQDSIHAVTSDLTLWPETQQGHTDKKARAEGKRYKAEGVGMTIDLLAGTLELHSKARGTYVP